MFAYEKFDIVEVAERCGIEFDSRTLNRREVEAWCPFCPTKSSSYHLSLNRDKERFFCHKCSASGNSVTLYARMFDLSNKEAAEKLSTGTDDIACQREQAEITPKSEMASLARRHDVYYDMLSAMNLSDMHRENLLERGLSEERISQNMYRSMPDNAYKRRRIAEYLSKRHDLCGIPGFYYSKYGQWELWGKPGILIPICNVDGYIQGLQIRLNEAKKKKYRWLTSNPDYGYPYGTATNTWVHITGNRPSFDTPVEAYITEGGLKGDTASYLSGDRLYICTAGTTSIRYLYDTLMSLNISKVNGCYDMDQVAVLNDLLERRKDPYDAEAHKPCPLEKMEAVVHSTKVPYERRIWPAEQNGIDTFYLDWLQQRQLRAA